MDATAWTVVEAAIAILGAIATAFRSLGGQPELAGQQPTRVLAGQDHSKCRI